MRKLDHDLRRSEIAESAARLIAAHGMEALTTRRLASAIGCSIGALNHYFDGKSSIVMAALEWARERIEARLCESLAREISIGEFLPLIEASLPHDEQSRIEWGVRLNLWRFASTDRDAAALLREHTAHHHGLLVGLLGELQKRGEIRPDIDTDDIARVMIDLTHGMGFATLLGLHHERHDPVHAFNTIVDQLRANPPVAPQAAGARVKAPRARPAAARRRS